MSWPEARHGGGHGDAAGRDDAAGVSEGLSGGGGCAEGARSAVEIDERMPTNAKLIARR